MEKKPKTLKHLIKQLKALDGIFDLFHDLTPEQIKKFDAEIKRHKKRARNNPCP